MNGYQNLFAVGLGAPRTLGALGPLGNASTITPGAYKSTGTGVNVRTSAGGGVAGALNIGDLFNADGTVDGAEVNGVYTNFARGTTGGGVSGWVAVEYLAPAGTFNPASYSPGGGGGGGGGGGIQEVSKTTTTTTTTVEKSFFEDNWPYFVGALAVGGIAYAAFGTKKGKAVRRLARAKYHKHRRARRKGRR